MCLVCSSNCDEFVYFGNGIRIEPFESANFSQLNTICEAHLKSFECTSDSSLSLLHLWLNQLSNELKVIRNIFLVMVAVATMIIFLEKALSRLITYMFFTFSHCVIPLKRMWNRQRSVHEFFNILQPALPHHYARTPVVAGAPPPSTFPPRRNLIRLSCPHSALANGDRWSEMKRAPE